jgi:hypothetical protein
LVDLKKGRGDMAQMIRTLNFDRKKSLNQKVPIVVRVPHSQQSLRENPKYLQIL